MVGYVVVELGRFNVADSSANALWAAWIHGALGNSARVTIEIREQG